LAAEASKRAIEESKHSDQPIATEIVAAGPFYEAEEYHQD
jgi:peptide methionine sulfoxide reductase MsrA